MGGDEVVGFPDALRFRLKDELEVCCAFTLEVEVEVEAEGFKAEAPFESFRAAFDVEAVTEAD